ncbi:DUF4231 domain-containing protein [Carnobacterium maltaromaticum]|uniref:DUF4231 domain-containing protein n=1 Tax=Carnobacterium maltaromaticum TaxID=2751 RepID=UPI0039BE133C
MVKIESENDGEKQLYLKLDENEKIYFETRLDPQIEWYDKKSIAHQHKFKRMKFCIMFSSATIPFLVAFKIENIHFKFLIGGLGVLITLLEGLINLNKHNENWIEYRSICETLKHEKYMYLYETGVYSDSDNVFNFFVERIETVISQENINWASLNKENGGKK